MQHKLKKTEHNNLDSKDLYFISDITIRNKIVEAINTMSEFYLIEQAGIYPDSLSKEIRRVIILYSASIIESLLLYIYKAKEFSLNKTEYKDVQVLIDSYQLDPTYKIVIAKQIKTTRNEREIMLDNLLKLFVNEKIITPSLEKKIKKAKDVRNTFHLTKSRSGLQCSKKSVNTSIDAVYNVVILVKNYLIIS